MNTIEKKVKEFEKLADHYKDYACFAHGEGQVCCLDKEHERHNKIKTLLRQALKEVYTQGKLDALGEWYLGKVINVFGGEYEIVGISRMIYDKDCEGDPEWKMTKEIQEVAIAKIYPANVTYQKPSWHHIASLKKSLINI